jgi:hypothetical protein
MQGPLAKEAFVGKELSGPDELTDEVDLCHRSYSYSKVLIRNASLETTHSPFWYSARIDQRCRQVGIESMHVG